MKKLLLISGAVLVAACAVAQGRIELRATMTGGKGKAVWKTRDSVSQLQAELGVEGERLTPGRIYRIVIGPNTWQVTTNAFGAFEFDRRYVGPNRPTIVSGTVVQLKNAAGQLVLSGVFR